MPGYLERFNSEIVSGWVPQGGAANDTTVTIVFNGEHKFQIQATIKRNDLPDNALGFELPLPENLKRLYPLVVECYCPSGDHVANSPRSIETRESELSKVLQGKDGWLFLANDSNCSIDYITGKKVISQSLLDSWRSLIVRRIDLMEQLKIPFVQVIVAEKETVYHEMLPDGYTVSAIRPAKQIIARLQGSAYENQVLYGPRYEQRAGGGPALYFKGDTHFSFHGAGALTTEIVSILKKFDAMQSILADVGLEDYSFCKRYQAGDLITKTTGVNIEEIDYPIAKCRPSLLFSTNEPRAGRVRALSNPMGSGRLLAFHTSSIDWMAPFLNDIFNQVLYVWNGRLDQRLISWFKPDCVIAQTNERFLTACPSE